MRVVKLKTLWSPCCPAKSQSFTDGGGSCTDDTRDDDRGQLYGCVRHRERLQLVGVGHLTTGEGERMKKRTEGHSGTRNGVLCSCQGSASARTVRLDDGGGRENGNRRGTMGGKAKQLCFCLFVTAAQPHPFLEIPPPSTIRKMCQRP